MVGSLGCMWETSTMRRADMIHPGYIPVPSDNLRISFVLSPVRVKCKNIAKRRIRTLAKIDKINVSFDYSTNQAVTSCILVLFSSTQLSSETELMF